MNDQPQDIFGSVPDVDGEVVTLTLLPRSRWQTLLNLDVIQVIVSRLPPVLAYSTHYGNQRRNKPKEPPKAPEKAPFFLPTLPGVETRFMVQEKVQEKTPTRRSEKTAANTISVFSEKLSQEQKEGNCERQGLHMTIVDLRASQMRSSFLLRNRFPPLRLTWKFALWCPFKTWVSF